MPPLLLGFDHWVESWGLYQPAYTGFEGAILQFEILLPKDEKGTGLTKDEFQQLNTIDQYMEVRKGRVMPAWRALVLKDDAGNRKLVIGTCGTKALSGKSIPKQDGEFAQDRQLLMLQAVDDILPAAIKLALFNAGIKTSDPRKNGSVPCACG